MRIKNASKLIETLIPELSDIIPSRCFSEVGKSNTEIANWANTSLNGRKVKCIKDFTYRGLCYNYAFDDGYIDTLEGALCCLHKGYINIDFDEAQVGDILTYETLESEPDEDGYFGITHFAKIHRVNRNLETIIIRSKWGDFGVFETDIATVLRSYGNVVRVWRKKGDIQ